MAVELKDLYAAISPQYHVRLHTQSCFGKMIAWTHVVEDIEFISSLHGEELVFCSGINFSSEEELKRYITELHRHHAGGLVMSFRGEETYSQEIIEYFSLTLGLASSDRYTSIHIPHRPHRR